MQTHDKSGGGAAPATEPKRGDDGHARVPESGRDKVQGEGDYEAARRHRRSATEHARSHDVEAEARAAEPGTPEDARALLEAERQGRERARGEDRRDVMQKSEVDASGKQKAT